MSELRKATERSSEQELIWVDEMAEIYNNCSISLPEKLVNPSLFMRRQELSYLLADYEIFKLVQNIKGSVFYFGVYHGAGFMTFANLAAALEPYNHTREIIGFDTFTGYPSITQEDKTHGKQFQTLTEGGFYSDSLELLNNIIYLYDRNRPLNHINKTSLIKGDLCITLPEYLEKNQHTLVSLVVLTVNLYEPTKTALSLLWPRIPKGGVIVIHSLNEEYYPGATKALLEVVGADYSIQTYPFAPNLAYVVK
ncbi:MAG: macrocin O-methyltransferase [Syntrophomonadaceae bacterium]|nr:macrocin O-methyltransferase [Syntrophomonadaceae bacterium]